MPKIKGGQISILIGTRPTLIKHAPIIRELERQNVPFFLIHAGQHYSFEMDRIFFRDLGIKYPKYVLKSVRKAKGHGAQTAEMLRGIEKILLHESPRAVLVGGDTNANLAGALAARKLHLKVGHVEAGARSFDWRMPEEHNRVMIDHISDWLFASSTEMKKNLLKENVRGKVLLTGSSIVDAVWEHARIAGRKSQVLNALSLKSKQYVLITIHREHNVDAKASLERILKGLCLVSKQLGVRVLFPVHPRTARRISEFGLKKLAADHAIQWVKPQGYLDFLKILSSARVVLTDSGGIQQEASILRVPCVTLRENTEWVETLSVGANRLAGIEPGMILHQTRKALNSQCDWKNPFPAGASRKIVSFVKKECYR
ncbi:MAG: UDP-N-acetylglucosamine 2-epimerase (non-hydrolyzing) [Candidatus Omnitrophica bacterium]|nr:UDP-N-acetylglucosamine 2-epimerase (non-hydrolyzing) [Candidatus Omnitrophota bacterium]